MLLIRQTGTSKPNRRTFYRPAVSLGRIDAAKTPARIKWADGRTCFGVIAENVVQFYDENGQVPTSVVVGAAAKTSPAYSCCHRRGVSFRGSSASVRATPSVWSPGRVLSARWPIPKSIVMHNRMSSLMK